MSLKRLWFHYSAWHPLPLGKIHINTTWGEWWKIALMFFLMVLVPQLFGKSLYDEYVANSVIMAFRSLFSLKSLYTRHCRFGGNPSKNRINEPRRVALLMELVSWKRSTTIFLAFLLFGAKCYVFWKGIQVEMGDIHFNQKVELRALLAPSPTHNLCLNITESSKRDFLMYEARNCARSFQEDGHSRVQYVPSVRTVDGSEQHCLPHAIDSLMASATVDEDRSPLPSEGYPHPIPRIKKFSRQAGAPLDFLEDAVTLHGTTYITLKDPYKRIIVRIAGLHRPGMTFIREMSLAVRTGDKPCVFTRIAFAVEHALRDSACFTRTSVVSKVKVPYLVINFVLVLIVIGADYFVRTRLSIFKSHDEEADLVEIISEIVRLSWGDITPSQSHIILHTV